MSLMRLQRALARAGVASRRKAEDLIRAGRVRVDGRVATIGASVDPGAQRITVDGRAVRLGTRTLWLALNKPVGYVVSRGDPEGRRTVFDLLPNVPGLTYVGRLDVMTSGLLLLTTDGGAAHRLTHPRFAVPRSYWLRVHAPQGATDAAAIRAALARRIVIDGRPV
ncbi:MAG: pseudouridine synthase, partial [Gemmatimonadales bacterium]